MYASLSLSNFETIDSVIFSQFFYNNRVTDSEFSRLFFKAKPTGI